MTKKTLFKIVTEAFAEGPKGLEGQIQDLLNDGWITVGSLCICRGRLYMPMQKCVDPEEQIPTDDTMTQQHPDAKKLGNPDD